MEKLLRKSALAQEETATHNIFTQKNFSKKNPTKHLAPERKTVSQNKNLNIEF